MTERQEVIPAAMKELCPIFSQMGAILEPKNMEEIE